MIKSVARSRSNQLVKPLSRRIRENVWSYVFLLPTFVLTLVFVVYPIIASAGYTLYNWDGIGNPTEFVGLRHFFTVATDSYFWNAFLHTIIYTAVLVPIQLCLALMLALVLNNKKLRLSNFYRAIYFSPVLTSMAVIGVVLNLLFSRVGNSFPQWMIDLGWVNPYLGITNDPRYALPAIIVVGIWHGLGINLVYFLAALQGVPQEIYEAATVDGAGSFTRFWFITVPMIRSVGTIIVFLAILGSLSVFDLVLVLTNGGPYYASEVVSTYIYSYAFTSQYGTGQANFGYASAASFFMSMLVLLVTVIQLFVINRARRRRAELELTF